MHPEEKAVYSLVDTDSNRPIGQITDEQLAFLVAQLEEESAVDRDYYIAAVTVDIMAQRGGDPALIALLRAAIGTNDGVELRWSAV